MACSLVKSGLKVKLYEAVGIKFTESQFSPVISRSIFIPFFISFEQDENKDGAIKNESKMIGRKNDIEIFFVFTIH